MKRYNPHFEENSPLTKRVEMRPCTDGEWVSIDNYRQIYFDWVEFAHLAHRVKCLIGAEGEVLTNDELIERVGGKVEWLG
jgi:hypothetical protein